MAEIFRHYLISGRVQGVGFRAFAQATALEIKLRGWVRNLDDGRVEAVVTGTETQISEFETRLKRGPAHGRVDALEVHTWRKIDDFKSFEVRKNSDKPCSEN